MADSTTTEKNKQTTAFITVMLTRGREVFLHTSAHLSVLHQGQLARPHSDLPRRALLAVQDGEVLASQNAELCSGQVSAHPFDGELPVCRR